MYSVYIERIMASNLLLPTFTLNSLMLRRSLCEDIDPFSFANSIERSFGLIPNLIRYISCISSMDIDLELSCLIVLSKFGDT